MPWSQYQDPTKPKKQSTSPLYTYTGGTSTSNYIRQQDNRGRATSTPRANVVTEPAGYSTVVSPYGSMPLTGAYAPSANTVRAQTGQELPMTGALTPEQLAAIGSQMIAADASAASAAQQAQDAIRTADIDYFAGLRGARQGARTAANDWRAVLAGSGLSRSPAIGLMQMERIRGGLTGQEIGLEAERRAAQAAARQRAREAAAGAAATRGNLAQQIAMYETGNTSKYLDDLYKSLLPSSGS
jgi:hypothetical protein